MTKLLYLDEQELFKSTAHVTKITTEDSLMLVELDQTIFYPQGGGQPCDQGTISGSTAQMLVESVKKEGDAVVHKGKMLNGSFTVEENVLLAIDKQRRNFHSRLQTAGHVIDACLFALGITGLVPSKGYHFPDGPFDEYIGTLEHPEQLQTDVEQRANLLIKENRKVIIRYVEPENVEKECGYKPTFVPSIGKVRLVEIYGFPPIPCGGTHVRALGEIGPMTIKKISSKKGISRIAYQLAKNNNIV